MHANILDTIDALARLQKRYGRSPSYARFWQAAAGGCIPARRLGRKWEVLEADLPTIARYFGLTAPAASPEPSDDAARRGLPGQPVEGKAEGLPAKPEPARGRRGSPEGTTAFRGEEDVRTSATHPSA